MRFTDDMNSHERRIMKPIIYIKYLSIIVSILDLALPMFHEYRIGLTSPIAWIIVICYGWSYLGTIGIVPRTGPLLIVGFLRIFQVFITGLLHHELIYITFFIVALLDIFLCLYIGSDMEKFENKAELIRRTGD